jgi:hypothetical protein
MSLLSFFKKVRAEHFRRRMMRTVKMREHDFETGLFSEIDLDLLTTDSSKSCTTSFRNTRQINTRI